MKCPQCETQRIPNHLFCGSCGHKFSDDCSSCGKPKTINHPFCGFCGHRHDAPESASIATKGLIPPVPKMLIPSAPVTAKSLDFVAGVFDWNTYDESKRMTKVNTLEGVEEGVEYIQKRINDYYNDYGFSVLIQPIDTNLPDLQISTTSMVMICFDRIARQAKNNSRNVEVTKDFLSVIISDTAGRASVKHWLTRVETMSIVKQYIDGNGKISFDSTWDHIES